jgi:hypothetical protein
VKIFYTKLTILILDFGHFALNAVGIVILGCLMVMRGNRQFIGFSLSILLVGGFLLWIVGRNQTQIAGIYFYVSHVGASGMLFGYFAVLITIPIFERPFQIKSFVSALVGGLLYGGLIFSLFNSDPSVSIEGHICGLVAGLASVITKFLLWPKYIKPRWEVFSGRLPFFKNNGRQILKETEEDMELAEQEPSQVVMVRPASPVAFAQPVMMTYPQPVMAPPPPSTMDISIQNAVHYNSSLRMDENYYDEVNAIVAREASKSHPSAEDVIFGSAAAAPIAPVQPMRPSSSQPTQNDEFLNPFA